MSLEDLINYVKEKTKGFPYKPLPVPRLITKRPVFIG